MVDQLLVMSHHFGGQPKYVIAGGGNCSYKNSEKIWVKASGCSMDCLSFKELVCLDRNCLKKLRTTIYSEDSQLCEIEVRSDIMKSVIGDSNKRPSVEATIHDIIPFAFVMHTHPTELNGVLCSNDSKVIFKECFGNRVIHIDYVAPGYPLFKEVKSRIDDFRKAYGVDAQIIFIENHGVFVGGNSFEDVLAQYELIENRIRQFVPTIGGVSVKSADELDGEIGSDTYSYINSKEAAAMYADGDLVRYFSQSFDDYLKVSTPFIPDHIVYCGSRYLYASCSESVLDQLIGFEAKYGVLPKVVFIEKAGLMILGSGKSEAELIMQCYNDLMSIAFIAESNGGVKPMERKQIEFIDNWEAESYRRMISKEKCE